MGHLNAGYRRNPRGEGYGNEWGCRVYTGPLKIFKETINGEITMGENEVGKGKSRSVKGVKFKKKRVVRILESV